MSMTSLLSLGANAMFAAQTQLQTTGHNIANASTPGYSRQEASLATVQGRYTGAGYVGRGVSVQTIERAVDSFKTNEVALTASTAAADKTRMTLLSQLEGAVGTGNNGIGQSATGFFNALADMAAAPNDPSARQVVLARADDLASMFRSTSAQIESLQSSVTQDVKSTVESVNSLAERIAQLNEAIAGTNGGSHSANDLLDQRDQLIQEVSGYVQVTRVEQDDGSMNLFIGGGQSLVLGRQANKLEAQLNPFDATRVQVNVNVAGDSRPLSQNTLGGGSLAGLMQFQDDDLVAMRNGLGQLAAGISGAVNAQQSAGKDLDGDVGAELFTSLQGNVVASRLNTGSPVSNLQGVMTLTDPQALQAAEYELKVASPGNYTLTRLPGGTAQTVVDGQELEGFKLNLSGLSGQATGNRFLLQPASLAAGGMKMVLSDPADLAAANEVVLKGASANTGSATVKSLILTGGASVAGLSLTFGATSGSGRAFSYTDAGVAVSGTWQPGAALSAYRMTAGSANSGTASVTSAVVAQPSADSVVTFGAASGAGRLYSYTDAQTGQTVTNTWTPGSSISANGVTLTFNAGGTPAAGDTFSVSKMMDVTLSGVPAAGDSFTASATPATQLAANNGNALALSGLLNGKLVDGNTFTDAYSHLLADLGVRSQSAESAYEVSSGVADRAQEQLGASTGVNLDEEAAKLLQYQQAYQAASKILQVAQKVFDTVLSLGQ